MLPRHRDISESSDSLSSFKSQPNHSIRVYILQAKLDASDTAELYALIDSQRRIPDVQGLKLELCGNASDANIIISNVRMRKRLERHLDWNIARQKAIVTPQWLRDSVQKQRPLPCGDYSALGDLHDETVRHCPDCNSYPCNCSPRPAATASTSHLPSADDATQQVTSPRILENYAARYACLRASPLVCPNQALAAELGVLRLHRDLEGKAINALSYERAISVSPIRTVPTESL
ncbi:hypothetical protein DXG03_001451 [Asterophora parasitica]|uniref:BRCT domain-containing protein n=1 Tax=Asterophora parasitica TaxID=117018 RepID=A0A9P7KCN4_9AGAR|nr:hypothetical protein DXG03_001451 [Asterophora parasitica]